MAGPSPDTLVIGAGLAGLACARHLTLAGRHVQVLEASDGPGGRVRTEVIDGFHLDRGFQVLPMAYPEARRLLDYDGLRLGRFMSGADIFRGGRFHRMLDPTKHLWAALRHPARDIGAVREKWQILLLRKQLQKIQEVPRQGPELTTEEYLRNHGFTDRMLDRFFRPFFGGIFLERELRTSSRVFQFVFNMLARAPAAIPARGMQAIPDQLASLLPADTLQYNCPVRSVAPGAVTLEDGRQLHAPHIILAVDECAAARLLHGASARQPRQRAVTCLYFSTADPALPADPILMLDGEGRGPVNHAAILTNVSPGLAPEGQRLISATVLGSPSSPALEGTVRQHLASWLGDGAHAWRHLKTTVITHAQPEGRQLHVGDAPAPPMLSPGLYQCGDYLEDVSINGALLSGRHAAEAVLAASPR